MDRRTFTVALLSAWASPARREGPEAIDASADKVRAYYQSIGFDVQATLARLGITASLGYYNAPPAVQ